MKKKEHFTTKQKWESLDRKKNIGETLKQKERRGVS